MVVLDCSRQHWDQQWAAGRQATSPMETVVSGSQAASPAAVWKWTVKTTAPGRKEDQQMTSVQMKGCQRMKAPGTQVKKRKEVVVWKQLGWRGAGCATGGGACPLESHVQ
ncbi:hypothetical protein ACOMHN_029210 [Nucella lapillus]